MSKRKFTLYWSSLKMYEECPQKFLWSKGWGQIDCGGGPGKKKPVPVQSSEHHAVMGIVLADFWEWLYNDEEWRYPQGVVDRILEKAKKEFSRLCLVKHIDWRLAPEREEMWQTIEQGIRGYFTTMKAQKLLGPYAKSEVDLGAYIDQYTPVGGRADLILRREDTGITILDGKNSKRYKGKKKGEGWITYTDPDQLRWYAMCFYLAYKVMPDRLGFVYFRYPYGMPKLDLQGNEIEILDPSTGLPTGEVEREEGVDWIPFDKEDLKGIAQRAKDALRAMDKEKFEATPSPSVCRMCDYESVCAQRLAQKRTNSARRNKKNDEFKDATGFMTLGFD